MALAGRNPRHIRLPIRTELPEELPSVSAIVTDLHQRTASIPEPRDSRILMLRMITVGHE